VHPGSLYKVKHHSGRILGPLDLERVRKLVLKNQIIGTEIAREYPIGEWVDINRIPEIAELLLQHAAGTLERSASALRSDQSSYRPILSPTKNPLQDQMAETVVLSNAAASTDPMATMILPQGDPDPLTQEQEGATGENTAGKQSAEQGTVEQSVRGNDSQATALLPPSHEAPSEIDEDDKTELATRTLGEISKTEIDVGQFRSQFASGSDDFISPLSDDASPALLEQVFEPEIRDPLADPEFKKRVEEATVFLNRPGLEPAKKRFRIPKGGEIARILLISAALGYFAYDGFLKENIDVSKQVLAKSASFRPSVPKVVEGRSDPEQSQKLYEEGLRYFTLDHVQGYRAAAARFSQSASLDSDNLKAFAMLASAYVNLIDTSTKDETFFSVISRLLELAKARGIDLPEIVIAEAEFLNATGRPDAAVQKIVEHTKGRSSFDPSLFVYVSEAFLEKGNPKEASKYIQNFPDNRAWSPRIFYLRGRIAEELGDSAGALEQFDKALKGWPTHSKSRLKKAELGWKAGNASQIGPDLDAILAQPDFLAPKDLALAYYLASQHYSVRQDYEAALVAIERALKLERNNSDYLLEYYTLLAREGRSVGQAKSEARMYYFLGEGEKALKGGHANEALAQFLNARTENPKSVQPLVKIGDMFLQLNDLPNARVNYQKAAEMAPNSMDIWSKYISILIQSYEWDDAQKAMDKFRKLPVGQSSIDKAAGDMYAKQNRLAEAANFYRKAMSRETIDPDVYIAYGKILMAAKSFKDAPFFFSLARRFDPLNTEPVILTAKAISEVEGPDAGMHFLQDEMQRGSSARAEYLSALAELEIAKGQWSSAQQYLDQARRANPEYAYPWKLQAQIYLNDENTDKKALDRALEAFKSYSDRNPSDPSGYLERYRIFMKKAQFQNAEEELNRIYTIYPKYPNLHFFKGVMYANMGNHKVAADEFMTELANNPNSATTLVALGKALLELGDAKTALTHLVKAMAIQPTNAEAKMHAAVANQRMKNYAGAIALFKAAVQIDTGNPLLYKRMGECYREMGDAMNARAAFQKYLQMEPDAFDKAEFERYL
jgi:tetratricopeptide (TPR) repeat protein